MIVEIVGVFQKYEIRCTREPVMECSVLFFFFKEKTAYEMRISGWSSDVCSSDLPCSGCARMWGNWTRRSGIRRASPARPQAHRPKDPAPPRRSREAEQ